MKTKKTLIVGIIVVILIGLWVSPAWAHQEYGITPQVTTKWKASPHQHNIEETVKPEIAKTSEGEEIDLLGGAFDMLAGAWKAISDTVANLLGGKEGVTPEAEKAKSVKTSSPPRRYRFAPHYSSGIPMAVEGHAR